MTEKEAIAIIVDIASRWGENAEEAFPRRILSTDTDQELRSLCQRDQEGEIDPYELEDAKTIRDLWLATELIGGKQK